MSCREEHLLRKLLPRCQGECGQQKYVRRPVADSSPLKPAISEPLSSVNVFRRSGDISHKRGTSPSPEAAAVLLWALASSRKRLLRSLQLSSTAWPLEAQTRSACNRLWPPGYINTPGICPGRTCLAACGIGGCGANDGCRHRQAVRPQRSSGQMVSHWCPCLDPLDSPAADGSQSVRATRSERRMRRS